jgi:hypothetical protein
MIPTDKKYKNKFEAVNLRAPHAFANIAALFNK